MTEINISIDVPYEHGLVPGDVVRIFLGRQELLRINLVHPAMVSTASVADARSAQS